MRGERMKRDMNMARGGVKEFDEVTVPTAIIPSGKLPYFYDKSYSQNESEVIRLANEAKARGANVDISKVLSDWRNDFKGSAMSRTDMPPAVKEALVKQIEAGEGLMDNTQTDESGVTDYAKEAEMYGRTSTSVQEQLAPQKTTPPSSTASTGTKAKEKADLVAQREGLVTAIETLSKRVYKNDQVTPEQLAKFNADKTKYESEKRSIEAKIEALSQAPKGTKTISDEEYKQILEKEYGGGAGANTRAQLDGWSSNRVHGGSKDRKWFKTAVDPNVARTRDYWQGKLAELEKGMPTAPNKQMDVLSDAEFNRMVEQKYPEGNSRYTAVSELQRQGWERSKDSKGNQIWVNRNPKDQPTIEALDFYKGKLAELDDNKKQSGSTQKPVDAELKKVNDLIAKTKKEIDEGKTLESDFWSNIGDWLKQGRIESSVNFANNAVSEAIIRSGIEITPQNVKKFIKENPDAFKPASFQSGELRRITQAERKIIDSEVFPILSEKKTELYATATTNKQDLLKNLEERKSELETRMRTGIVDAKPSDIAKAQQAQAPAQAKPEPSYTLTNQRNMALGTTTTQVASSIENKRNDMKTFFTNKYGYVPASFEESFKAIYPEANFKTMETPYGVFMHDGKDWKQIQVQQPKVMSNKEIAEEKSVTFGQQNAQGGLEFQELVPKSGVYVRGIFAGTPTEAFKFRTEMLETANAKVAVNRLIEINDMVGESMPWNAKLWGEAKALLPQIKAGLRTDIIGVGTVSNYEQQLIEEVVADPTKFWSLESSDRAKLTEIMRRVTNRLADKPALYGLEVKTTGQSNTEIEKTLRLGRAGKSKLELDFEARGGKKGVNLNWDLSNKIPDALK
jgi:hypothetical protein